MAYQKPTCMFTLDSSDELRKAERCTRTEILCAPVGSSPLHFHFLIYNNSSKELMTLHHYFSTFNAVTRPACVCQKSDDAHSPWYGCSDEGRVFGGTETNWLGSVSCPITEIRGRSQMKPKWPISWSGKVQILGPNPISGKVTKKKNTV